MSFIPNRNNKITDFKIGDKVVYNPYIDNLIHPKNRPGDQGIVIKIDLIREYIYMVRNRCCSGGIKIQSVEHYPPIKNKIILITI
jgi:hypothetical protein